MKKKLAIILIILLSLRVLIKSYSMYNIIYVVTPKNFESYYIHYLYNKDKKAFKLDEHNVTYIDYSKMSSLGVTNGISYYPISISFSALKFLQKDKKTLFLSQANWLVQNIENDGAWYVDHNKTIGKYKLIAPWSSALSQGFGISTLVRAYRLTGDKKYIVTARRALEPFEKYINEGGIVSHNEFGDFYEEYPLKKQPTHVLNGFIYSLFGLYDLYKYDDNQKAKKLFDKGIITLKKSLPKYNLDNWVRYDLNPSRNFKNHYGYSSPWYQKIYVVQLYALYQITDDKYFLEYSKKFEKQVESSWVNFIIYPAYIVYTDFVKIYRFIKG